MDTTASTASGRYDVVVVGGGAAGLSGALALARARRRVLVVDAGSPRNAPAAHVHNYLGREGTPPLELLAIGRGEVAGYGGEIVDDRVIGLERIDGGFTVALADGAPVEARRVLVTTGLVDVLPEVDGLAERWGIDVLHCPYCHGWEVQDQRIAVLANNGMAARYALMWHQWSPHLTLVTHPDHPIAEEDLVRLGAVGVTVVDGPAVALEVADDRLTGLRLADGSEVACDAVAVAARVAARAEALAPLGLTPSDFVMGGESLGTYVAADPMGKTEVPGVWVAGNVTSPADTVVSAAAAAMRTAGMINLDLIEEDADAAVAALA